MLKKRYDQPFLGSIAVARFEKMTKTVKNAGTWMYNRCWPRTQEPKSFRGDRVMLPVAGKTETAMPGLNEGGYDDG